jgi:hypothetical protein
MDLLGLEVHVFPLQREQLAPAEARGYCQQHQGPSSKAQICEQCPNFIAGQDIWCFAALSLAAYHSLWRQR